jgi:tetratricopeptide (TPR) repeat protein
MNRPGIPADPIASDGVEDERSGLPERIGGRYLVRGSLGSGGMAVVYRVFDPVTQRELALKQLRLPRDARNTNTVEALFEYEFKTLAELHHPRVIEVYDYGVADGRRYYTMELLDGGDLTQLAPLPWRQACELMYDVGSSLALLHSRRLVHRDVSPHNVRRTRDGHAKLMDFGAMARMGPSTDVVGNPPFVAPEVVSRAALDAGTDLFSFGATLYFALTGKLAYPARAFAQLLEVWRTRPANPSSLVPEIPARLDALVMSMLSLERAMRPRSASEVMQQLASVAELRQAESLDVSQAYLSTPRLLGREALLLKVQRRVDRAGNRHGSCLMLEGAAGSGRSRALEACVLEAKQLGALTLSVGAKTTGARPFALAEACAALLRESVPELDFAAAPESAGDRDAVHSALVRCFLEAARDRTLVLAIDDVERTDAASGAWLATLADRVRHHRLLVLSTVERDVRGSSLDPVVEVLAERSARVTLDALSRQQTEQLFDSVFGDVPNVGRLSDRIFRVSQGNPRASMELAQHLVDRRVLLYDDGGWTLPAQLDPNDLPVNMAQAFVARVAALSPSARKLAGAHALSTYAGLSQTDAAWLGERNLLERSGNALSELSSHSVLAGDGQLYTIASDAWRNALEQSLSESERSALHLDLAELGLATQRPGLSIVHHLLAAGQPERALDHVAPLLAIEIEPSALRAVMHMTSRQIADVLGRALTAAEALRRRPREIAAIQHWLCLTGIYGEVESYARAAPAWRKTLQRDSGFDAWLELPHLHDKGARVTQALERAVACYEATPDTERTYRADEAIKHLVQYTVASLVVGTNTFDAGLVRSLPELIEPFAILAPILDIMLHNLIATRDATADARFMQARESWLVLIGRLGELQGDASMYAEPLRYAWAFGLGTLEVGRSMASSEAWAELLDRDALQKVNAMYLRKVVRLQLGDTEGAERFRRHAELLAVQADSPQMFTSMLVIELVAHAMADDLIGLQQVAERIKPLAERHRGWLPYLHVVDGSLARVRGELLVALQSFERALRSSEPDPSAPERAIGAWLYASVPYAQILIALGRYEEAKTFAAGVLEQCARREITWGTDGLVCALALAEARLGDYANAISRLSFLIDWQRQSGVTGLLLGASYEARARIAIWAGDRVALDEFARLTAREYRHGNGSALGVHYEKLMAEARVAGVRTLPQLSDFETSMFGATALSSRDSAAVAESMSTAASSEERAQRALQLVCGALGAHDGYLYLVDEDGSTALVASRGARTAGAAELGLARACVERVLSEDFGTTSVMTDADASTLTASVDLYTEVAGVLYQAVAIHGVVRGQSRIAAVATLEVATASTSLSHAHAVLTAIGTQLLEAGDTLGVTDVS